MSHIFTPLTRTVVSQTIAPGQALRGGPIYDAEPALDLAIVLAEPIPLKGPGSVHPLWMLGTLCASGVKSLTAVY